MRMKPLIAAALAAFVVPNAHAMHITTIWRGTMSAGSIDSVGLFAPAGTDLSGLPIKLVFNFDTKLGKYSKQFGEVQYSGGFTWGDGSPSTGATIALNGHSLFIDGTWNGIARSDQDAFGEWSQFSLAAQDQGGYVQEVWGYVYQHSPRGYGTDNFNNFDGDVSGDYSGSRFIMSHSLGGLVEDLHFTNDHLTIRSFVPEPATWMMAFLGFAFVGVAQRRASGRFQRNDRQGRRGDAAASRLPRHHTAGSMPSWHPSHSTIGISVKSK